LTVNKPTKLEAARTAVALSLLFFVVYGGTNWIAAHRSDVGTWYYSWERFIPFVPLMVVPYMSIDLLFVAAPFICSGREELKTLARRISFAILVAGIFFLAMPLKMGVSRPEVGGWTGAIFHFLHGFDHPYNLFPSLHITFRTILARHYARHTRGVARAGSHVWFSLIGFSTLLTYQHHIVDIAGGFVLAGICFYIFQENRRTQEFIPNQRIGGYYVAGSLLCLAAVLVAWPWTAILLWPAFSLAVVALGYFWLGPAIYEKKDGTLSLSTRLVMAPALLGQYLSLLYYRRHAAAWSEITPRLWIGARLNQREVVEAKRAGVTAVLDLTAEFSEPKAFRDLAYCNIPVLDLTELSGDQLREAVGFISRQTRSGIVYVHCKVGYSRSAAAVAAYLVESGHAAGPNDALELLKRSRRGIIFRLEVFTALQKFCGTDCSKSIEAGETLFAVRG
jgi:protein-tyrosine phosphatase/membrane-associated phospholipid phosphatase